MTYSRTRNRQICYFIYFFSRKSFKDSFPIYFHECTYKIVSISDRRFSFWDLLVLKSHDQLITYTIENVLKCRDNVKVKNRVVYNYIYQVSKSRTQPIKNGNLGG